LFGRPGSASRETRGDFPAVPWETKFRPRAGHCLGHSAQARENLHPRWPVSILFLVFAGNSASADFATGSTLVRQFIL
jgi:hypothetical protein